jgi:hypothetical protein
MMRSSGSTRPNVVLVVLAAIAISFGCAGTARAADQVVPDFVIQVNAKSTKLHGKKATQVNSIVLTGPGVQNLHPRVQCDRHGCVRVKGKGKSRRVNGTDSVIFKNVNWILAKGKTFTASISQKGLLGRYKIVAPTTGGANTVRVKAVGCSVWSKKRVFARAACPPPPPAPPKVYSQLNPGDIIRAGDVLRSPSAWFTVEMSADGDLQMLNRYRRSMWGTATSGHAGAFAKLQADGNLVVASANGDFLWASGTGNHPGAYATLDDSSDFGLYLGAARVWVAGANNAVLATNEMLLPGMVLRSPQRAYTLAMQLDGNLVLYGPGGALWTPGVPLLPGSRAIMQGDGNFVIYPPGDGPAEWSIQRGGYADGWLQVQDDGNLVVYKPPSVATWWRG